MPLTVAALRKHVTSALDDAALQKLLDAAYEAIDAFAGPDASAAVPDWLVASTNMQVGAYTLANAAMPNAGMRRVTVTHTAAGGADTLGTIDLVGLNSSGQTVSESVVPLAGATATGTRYYASITSITGTGWVIAAGNDTITVGCEARGVVDMLRGTSGPLLMLTRPAAAIVSVSENSVLLDPLDYELRPSGRVLERLRTGPHPRWYWQGRVDVASRPQSTAEARDLVAIGLVQLDVTHNPGITSETIGDWSETYADNSAMNYGLEREAILGTLLAGQVGIY